jgi:hypothetical protein
MRNLARVQLFVAAILFVSWLGYLAYLALGQKQPIIVSHSQLMNATSTPLNSDAAGSWVVAEVDLDEKQKPKRAVRIKKVLAGAPIPEESIIVSNLLEARIPPNKPVREKGTYFLPLVGSKDMMKYSIAPARGLSPDNQIHGPLIYPWTPEVEEQLKQLTPESK